MRRSSMGSAIRRCAALGAALGAVCAGAAVATAEVQIPLAHASGEACEGLAAEEPAHAEAAGAAPPLFAPAPAPSPAGAALTTSERDAASLKRSAPRFVEIPEPLHFDLVRGLHAEAGEYEVNTLVVTLPRRGRTEVLWAPEVELAILDGFAVEFELPMDGRRLEALKGAIQGRLPGSGETFIHGLQFIGEYVFDYGTELTPLYLLGGSLGGDWTAFAMVGSRLTLKPSRQASAEILLNPSVYYALNAHLAFGLEINGWLHPGGANDGGALVAAQVHWGVTEHFKLQLGAGWQGDTREGHAPALLMRAILE